MSKPVILLGAGGHASVLLDILLKLNIEVIAVAAPKTEQGQALFKSIKHISDSEVLNYDPECIELVNGIGSIPGNILRKTLNLKFKEHGFKFRTVVAPSAEVSSFAKLDQGVQILSGAVIQAGSIIGENVIVNTRSSVDHDSHVLPNSHVAPGATISGDVVIGEDVHIGAGATVIHGINISDNTIVGAGSCITKDIEKAAIVYPAKVFVRELNT